MPGVLQDTAELSADIEGRGKRQITKQDLLDLIESLASVGGTLNTNGGSSPEQDIVGTGSWQRIDAWERSIDTKGVQDGLRDETDPGGWFKVRNKGSGTWSINTVLRFTTNKPGTYRFRVAKVLADGTAVTTPFQDRTSLEAGEQGHVAIIGARIKNVLAGEKLQVEMRAPNGAIVTLQEAQFAADRT